jgi:hypothetical protein
MEGTGAASCAAVTFCVGRFCWAASGTAKRAQVAKSVAERAVIAKYIVVGAA